MIAKLQSFSRENKFAWFFVLFAATYSVFSTAFHQTEFSHMDIVYNYGPIRSWFADQIRSGVFPLWDPFIGLGRFAESWTSIPVDILSLIEIPFGLSYRAIIVIQIVSIFILLRIVLSQLRLSPLTTTLTTLFFLLGPITGYFLRYYVKGWLFLLYGILFVYLYLYVTERKRSYLGWLALCSFVFSLGSKFEYIVTLGFTTVLAYSIFVLLSAERGVRIQLWWRGLAAFICPLLLNFWSFNLVMNAAKATLRLSRPPVVWSDFFYSLGYSFLDPHFVALIYIAIILILSNASRPRAVTWGISLVGVSGLFIFGAQQPLSGYAIGIFLALALLLWRNRQGDLQGTTVIILKAAVLLFYFTRPAPGDVDEMAIIQWFSRLNEGIFGFLCMAGLGSRRAEDLVKWGLVLIGVVFFYRSLGLVFLNYFAGVLWLPARDNFLIELPLALFMAFGWSYLFKDIFQTSRKWTYAVAGIFLFMLLQNHPFINKPLRLKVSKDEVKFEWKKEQLSDVLQREMEQWRDGLKFEPFGQVRILSYFHTYGRKFGIADTREYQSLVSAPYARYSIASRLGIEPSQVKDVASTTLGLTPRFQKLVRPVQPLDSIVHNARLRGSFYMFYILSAAPKLACDHLRVLGIRYLEADYNGYYNTNAGLLTGLYSSMEDEPKEGVLNPDVAAKVAACNFETLQVGERKFWVVGNPLPRAFFLSGVTAESLKDISLDEVRVEGDNLRIRGSLVPWKPANIDSYSPNRVVVSADSAGPGVLVLSDLYNEQWLAKVSGAASTVAPAFSLIRAVDMPGSGKVEFALGYPGKMKVILLVVLGLAGLALLFRGKSSAY